MNVRSLLTWGAVVLLSLSGCSSSGGESPEAEATSDPSELSRLVPSHLTVSVTGDVNVEFDSDVDLRIVSILSSMRFLSVGIEDVRTMDSGAAFRIAFDLVGRYEGPGRYEIPAVGGTSALQDTGSDEIDPNLATEGLSRMYFTFNAEGDPADDPARARVTQLFENVLEPCPLEVGRAGESGRVSCPQVADGAGNVVRIEMEWRKR